MDWIFVSICNECRTDQVDELEDIAVRVFVEAHLDTMSLFKPRVNWGCTFLTLRQTGFAGCSYMSISVEVLE